jgi:hypothetical protein
LDVVERRSMKARLIELAVDNRAGRVAAMEQLGGDLQEEGCLADPARTSQDHGTVLSLPHVSKDACERGSSDHVAFARAG